MNSKYSESIRGLEDVLKKLDQVCLWEIYEMQGFQGLSFALRSVPKNVYEEVWTYIKNNKTHLRFYLSIPDDI